MTIAAIVDLSNDTIVVSRALLPYTLKNPNGKGRVRFFKHDNTFNNRYKAVPVELIDNRPGQYYSPIGEDSVYDVQNGKVVTTVQYPGSPNVHEPTSAEIIDAAFPDTGIARVLFEALFELSNRIIALEGGNAITRAQLKTWLQGKLP
jgi:hypothetical protein